MVAGKIVMMIIIFIYFVLALGSMMDWIRHLYKNGSAQLFIFAVVMFIIGIIVAVYGLEWEDALSNM